MTELQEGALYALPKTGKGYAIVKVLGLIGDGGYIRVYSNLFDHVPDELEEESLFVGDPDDENDVGLAFLPTTQSSLRTWRLTWIQSGEVTPSEAKTVQRWIATGYGLIEIEHPEE